MGQGKSHQRAKIGFGFGHYLKQEIWTNNEPRKRAIKWLKWAWVLDITTSKKFGPIIGQREIFLLNGPAHLNICHKLENGPIMVQNDTSCDDIYIYI
jgi:hypothetical protein